MYGRRNNARLGDASSVVTDVTGFLQNVQGYLDGAKTEIAKIDNAVKGAATGAQVGYNSPTSVTPILIGGIVILALVLVFRE